MKYDELTSKQRDVFAGILSADGANCDLLLEALVSDQPSSPYDNMTINDYKPDNTVVNIGSV